MCIRIESQLGEIGEFVFCLVILVKQGNVVLSRLYFGRESYQLVWFSFCVGEVLIFGFWDFCWSILIKIGDFKRYVGGRLQLGLVVVFFGGWLVCGFCVEVFRFWGDSFCVRCSVGFLIYRVLFVFGEYFSKEVLENCFVEIQRWVGYIFGQFFRY